MPPSALRAIVVDRIGERDEVGLARLVPARAGLDLGALVAAARESQDAGAGTWKGAGDDPSTSDDRASRSAHVRDLLLAHAGSEGPGDAVLLDLIALVPEARASWVEGLAAAQVPSDDVAHRLRRLEARGVVAVMPGEHPRVRLTDGIVELLLPQTLAVLRRRRLTRAVVDALAELTETLLAPREQIVLASLSLELGRDVSPALLTASARASLSEDDPMLSIGLAAAAVENGGGVDAETALAVARLRMGRIDEVLERMQTLSESADGGPLLGIVSDLMLLASDRLELPRDLDRHSDLVAATNTHRVVLDAFLLFALGDWGAAARRLASVLDEVDGPLAARAHFVFASGALLTGWFGAAERSLDRAEEILTAAGDDTTHIRLARLTIGRYTGRLEESLQQSKEIRDLVVRFGPSHNSATAIWTVGTLLLISGRVREAVGELDQAVGRLEESGMDRMALIAMCELSEAYSVLGSPEQAIAARLPVSTAIGAGAAAEQFRGTLAQTRAWTLAAEGRIDEAAEGFIAAAEAFTLSGHSVGALVALVSAARCGAARRVLSWVESAAADIDDPFGPVLRDLVHALADGEGFDARQADHRTTARARADRLIEVGERARVLGFHLLSAEAYARAARARLEAGEAREAAAAARHRDEQMRICGIERLILVPDLRVRPLSLREAEIADLAAEGLSNREISEKLVLSIRTVETHLLRVYQKLGIRRRGELADALRTAPRATAQEQ